MPRGGRRAAGRSRGRMRGRRMAVRMTMRRRRRRRRRRILLVGGMIAVGYAGYKMSKRDVERVEEQTGPATWMSLNGLANSMSKASSPMRNLRPRKRNC